ncbi:MAG TPA: hypothetical protein VHZ78_08940 [Rhizomicrobium sp.]|jgi:hypothetical protein|nr:hypothetical protein [Rhizomicrobium sp.]
MRFWLLLLIFPMLVSGAQAAETPAPCEPSYMPRCKWIAAGDAPLKAVAARGDETLRFDYSAFLRPQSRYAIEASRGRAGIVRVTVRGPLVEDAAISLAVAPAIWPRLLALRARVIDEDAAAQIWDRVEHLRIQSGRVECLDGASFSIGSALGGKAEDVRLDDCATRAVDAIADEIHDAFYMVLPFCRTLDAGLNRRDKLLFGCNALGGAYAVAARFAPAILAFSERDMCAAPDQAMLAAGASLQIADTDKARGGVWRGPAIFAALCRHHLVPRVDRVVAWPSEITVVGRVFGTDGKPASLPPACSTGAVQTQLWRIDGGKAKLEQWVIGSFAPVCWTMSPAPMPVRK